MVIPSSLSLVLQVLVVQEIRHLITVLIRKHVMMVCNFCNKNGHLRSDCRALRKPLLKESIKPTGLTSNKPSSHKSRAKNNVVVEVTKSQPDSVMEIYEPFISEGMVSFMDDSTKPIRIKILRDTGASQSIIFADDLPFSEKTYSGTSVLYRE